MVTWVVEVTEFNSGARCDLEAILRLPWPQRPLRWPLKAIHMDTRVIYGADFKSNVNLYL